MNIPEVLAVAEEIETDSHYSGSRQSAKLMRWADRLRVAACHQCNSERGRAAEQGRGLLWLQQQSGRTSKEQTP